MWARQPQHDAPVAPHVARGAAVGRPFCLEGQAGVWCSGLCLLHAFPPNEHKHAHVGLSCRCLIWLLYSFMYNKELESFYYSGSLSGLKFADVKVPLS